MDRLAINKLTIKTSLTLLTSAIALMASSATTQAYAATLSVGSGKTFTTPCQALNVAAPGDVIEIDAATSYVGDVCVVPTSNLTIRGVNGRPKIDAGGQYAGGKGTWVISGNNVTVENVEMFGAKVPDQNGAAIRLEGSGFTIRGSFLHDNENGILTTSNPTSDILVENTEFGHNGFGDGYSHNLYVGQVKSLTFRNSYSHDANVGHNLKSRAQLNTISYSRFSSTSPGQAYTTATGQPSYEIDLPNAGTAYVIGNVIQQPAANQNPILLAFGEEGANNATQDLYVVNNTFLNNAGSGGTFMLIGSGVTTPVLIQNNIFGGVGAVTTQSNSIDRTNYKAMLPPFVNRSTYDLRPAPGSPMIDAGSAPGISTSGVSLMPVAQYVHNSSSQARPVNGPIDIGAYEAAGASAAPAPTPTPTPIQRKGKRK